MSDYFPQNAYQGGPNSGSYPSGITGNGYSPQYGSTESCGYSPQPAGYFPTGGMGANYDASYGQHDRGQLTRPTAQYPPQPVPTAAPGVEALQDTKDEYWCCSNCIVM